MGARRRSFGSWTLACALALAGCGATQHRFALADPIWVDDDMQPFATRPAELYTPAQWDRIDHTLFRRLSEVFLYELDQPALNVNALDEVPSSSWFENRVGRGLVTPAQVRSGACDSPGEPPLPWTVIRAKQGGSSPGLVIRDADGQTSIFKIDFGGQPERATASDSIATRMFWAAGYYTPCNRVVTFRPEDLVLATEPDGDHPLPTDADVQRLLDGAFRMPDGTLRASVSEYIPGRPLGGWRFAGLRTDDPNDVFPHEHRREVRGMYVLSAWLNHIDTRAENNMDAWIEEDGRGYVRHMVLDAGDSFGQWFPTSLLLSQSFGLSHYLDLGHLSEDFLTLGIVSRPYFDAPEGEAFDVLGYYDVERFDPSDWRNGYPNPAFDRATEEDRAWMARIIARFDEPLLRAAIASGRFSREETSSELLRIVRGRQHRILERFLTRLSPLTDPEVGDGMLCLHDLALESRLRSSRDRRYRARAWQDWPHEGTERVRTVRAGTRVCVELPSSGDASAERPRYRVVDVIAGTVGRETTGPARVHLYEVGPGAFRVVGLERPQP